MAVRQQTKSKVSALLSIVYEKCRVGKPFEMRDIVKLLACDGGLPTVLVRAQIIQNGGGHGPNKDCKYKWIAPKPPTDDLVEYVLEEVEAYRKQANERRKKKAEAPLQLPEVVVLHPDFAQTEQPSGNEPEIFIEKADPRHDCTPEPALDWRLLRIENDLRQLRTILDEITAARTELRLAGAMLKDLHSQFFK